MVKCGNIAVRNLQIFYIFVLPAEKVTIFTAKMVTSARNTNIYNSCNLHRAIFSVFYNASQQTLQFY